MKQEFAKVVEIRKGRQIYLRKVVLDGVPITTTTTAERPNSLQMIFVHGICGTEQQYQLVLQSIHDQFQSMAESSTSSSLPKSTFTITCWFYDQVGCGQSPILPYYNDYSYKETQDDLKALLLAERSEQKYDFPTPLSQLPTIVVGHSYGPSIFIPLLQANPNLLPHWIGLVLISTSVRCPHLPLADGGHVIMRLPVVLLQCLQSQMTEAFIELAVDPKHTELRDIIRIASQKNNMMVAKSYHRHAKWMTMLQLQQAVWRSREHMSNAVPPVHPYPPPLPTLIIHGTNDGVTPIECGQYMYNELSSSSSSYPSTPTINSNNNDHSVTTSSTPPPITFVPIDVASHMVMIEQPNETAKAIVNFISALSY